MSLPRLAFAPPRAGALTPLGAFKDQITLLAAGVTNADGSIQNRSPFAVGVWAAIRSLSASESDKQQQIEQKVTHLVAIMFVQGVTIDMQVQHTADGIIRTFQILDIEDVNNSRFELRMLCAEVGQSPQ